MTKIILYIAGFYFVLIGTWLLATATTVASTGVADAIKKARNEHFYNPLRDIISILPILSWLFKTIVEFIKPGKVDKAIILHKQFNRGLLWLLLGLFLQFITFFV